jgi:cell division septation protein DedD
VVVVLLMPEMFRGRPAGVADRGVAGSEGAPLRTYNIDLRDSPAALPPAVAAQGAIAAQAGAPAQAAVVPPAAVEPAPAVAPATAVAPPAAVAEQPASGAAPEAPKIAPAAKAPAAKANSRPGAGAAGAGWTVQVGSFTRRDFADRMVKQVRALGFRVEAVGPDDRGLFRVRSAPLSERASALALKQKMQARGLKPIVNAAP